MKQKQKKIIDGRLQLGIVSDWILKQDVSPNEYWVYMIIARASLNQYHRKQPNINQKEFKMNKNTLKKYRDILVEKGYISWINTKAYTAYKLLEPKELLDTFKFRDKEKEDDKIDVRKKIKLFG